MTPAPAPADWTCPVCGATHAVPTLRCRRCAAALVPFARLAAAARILRESGRTTQAEALFRDGRD